MPNTNTNRTFSASIIDSNRELSAVEKVKMKDTRDAISLEQISREQPAFVGITGYVVLHIHNEKSDDKEYEQYMLIGANGEKYVTGSLAFFNSFLDIWMDLAGEEMPAEGWTIKVYQLPSKNFKDRNFVTCSLA
jgi:hypothetical protein